MQERPLAAHVKRRLLVLEVHQGWDVPQHHLSPVVLHEVLKYSSGMDFLLFGRAGIPQMITLVW